MAISYHTRFVVIFSSRDIPGNEVSIKKIQNSLVEAGIRLITADDFDIHTSGHPNQDDLIQMYQWIKPSVSIPVHGEMRHMVAHAELAKGCQVPHGIVPRNGMLIKITEDGADVIDEVPSGRLMLDGSRITYLDNEDLKYRRKMAWGGIIFATVILDMKGRIYQDPFISIEGLLHDQEAEEKNSIFESVERAITNLSMEKRRDDQVVRDVVRVALRRIVDELTGKKPRAIVHVVRI